MKKSRPISSILAVITALGCLFVTPGSNFAPTAYAAEETDTVVQPPAEPDAPVENGEVTFSLEAGTNITGQSVELTAPDGYDIFLYYRWIRSYNGLRAI